MVYKYQPHFNESRFLLHSLFNQEKYNELAIKTIYK